MSGFHFGKLPFDCPATDIEVNGNPEGQVPAGSTVDVQLSDSVGAVTPLSITQVGTDFQVLLPDSVCPDTDIEVNGVAEGSVVAGSTLDIQLTDGTNPVNPNDVTLVGQTLTIEVPSGGCRDAAMLLPTGQTASQKTGDDGDLRIGRLTDFYTLNFLNHFGTNHRFTGVTGGYYDRTTSTYRDVNGNIVSYAVAFPDALLIDWATLTCQDDFVMWDATQRLNVWDNAIDGALASTVGGYNDWFLPNGAMLYSLRNSGVYPYYNYPELPLGGAGFAMWSSTSDSLSPSLNADAYYNAGLIQAVNKAANLPSLYARIGNISEL